MLARLQSLAPRALLRLGAQRSCPKRSGLREVVGISIEWLDSRSTPAAGFSASSHYITARIKYAQGPSNFNTTAVPMSCVSCMLLHIILTAVGRCV